jgi:hypothetical protein
MNTNPTAFEESAISTASFVYFPFLRTFSIAVLTLNIRPPTIGFNERPFPVNSYMNNGIFAYHLSKFKNF